MFIMISFEHVGIRKDLATSVSLLSVDVYLTLTMAPRGVGMYDSLISLFIPIEKCVSNYGTVDCFSDYEHTFSG